MSTEEIHKCRAVGLRMVYVVEEETNTLTVYVVGKRDKKYAYRKAKERIDVRRPR